MSDNMPTTLRALADEYIAGNVRVKSRQTVMLYVGTLRRFEEYLGRPGTLADFTDKQIVGFIRAARRSAQGRDM